ncbi:TetR/AcrR family transcriptional regulator C-terminal domain-containing protein [Leucobacter salsicius]|uniref:TetR/AcrR family transcriptional regulator C-terminal domain-containing protein n=1 Tax=Leucobacter salsicius TaxID=664638 RepID=UPI00034B331A|nr:TetR/AcrR family transcriptional regulator C-terminal domain-containing protein [Leucobacter salsicius]
MTTIEQSAEAPAVSAGSDAFDAPKRRVGRPRKNVLSRQLIIETGLTLIDEHGVEGAGMRSVAKRLGVRPSALYNHVSGQAELIAGVRELVSDRIPTEAFDHLPWDEALTEWAKVYRRAFVAHPSTIALLAVVPIEGAGATTLMYDRVVDALVRAGWDTSKVLVAIVALESFILGSALDAAAPDDMMKPSDDSAAVAFAEAYRARESALGARETRPADASFELGLRAMVAGLKAEFDASR